MLVISSLTVLMNDQVSKLNNLGIPVISLVGLDDPDLIQQVTNRLYVIVYTSFPAMEEILSPIVPTAACLLEYQ